MKKLVMMDVDGTLLNEAYKPTAQGEWAPVRQAVANLQATGSLVGLNSDTPLKTLRYYSELLGLRGPIIGELGQIVAWGTNHQESILGTDAPFFSDFRARLIARLLSLDDHPMVVIGDVNQYPRTIHGQVHRRAFLVNGMRQCSFSMFAFARDGDALIKDDSTFGDALALMKAELGNRSEEEFWFDEGRKSSILIMHEKAASKSHAYAEVISHFGDDWEYVMIGDGDSDIIAGTPMPVMLCAVGNARESLLDAVTSTKGIKATADITEGVCEILSLLAS